MNDYSPITVWVDQRIVDITKQIARLQSQLDVEPSNCVLIAAYKGRIDELVMVKALIVGLDKTNDLIAQSFRSAGIPINFR